MDAILLYTTVAVFPMPPDVENTGGEKDPLSISEYSQFLSLVRHNAHD